MAGRKEAFLFWGRDGDPCLIAIAITTLKGCAEAMANPLHRPVFRGEIKGASGAHSDTPDVRADFLACSHRNLLRRIHSRSEPYAC